jgi:phosphoribosyl-AMP cyclohydrolase / phosphoribosyl-ATP pyrophosphohydrolase
MLIPSIDLMDGKAVQLVGGREKVLEVDDVVGLARRFRVYGEIAVVDLDAATGRGDNLALVERLCREARCRVGGGVRDAARAERLLRAGAERVVVGTAATEELLRRLPRERVVVALDQRDGRLLSEGWQRTEAEPPLERLARLEGLCAGFLVTAVHREGRLAGPDLSLARTLRAATTAELTYAGGVTTAAEVAELDRMGLDAQVGMALYTGRLDPADAFLACLDWDKGAGLVPCVVQEETGAVLMVAWQSRESLRGALETGRGVYFSRSRGEVWVKGATSGHTQELLLARADCDRDALLFTVRQTGPACHTGRATCFGAAEFGLADLERVVAGRLASPPPGSYTARLFAEPGLLDAKLREELAEVVEAQARPDDLVWECADLLYFLLARMAASGITLRQVSAELERRRAVPGKSHGPAPVTRGREAFNGPRTESER